MSECCYVIKFNNLGCWRILKLSLDEFIVEISRCLTILVLKALNKFYKSVYKIQS